MKTACKGILTFIITLFFKKKLTSFMNSHTGMVYCAMKGMNVRLSNSGFTSVPEKSFYLQT